MEKQRRLALVIFLPLMFIATLLSIGTFYLVGIDYLIGFTILFIILIFITILGFIIILRAPWPGPPNKLYNGVPTYYVKDPSHVSLNIDGTDPIYKPPKTSGKSSSSPSSNESQPVNPKSHLLSNLNQASSSSDYPKPDIVICTTLAENAASDVNSAEEVDDNLQAAKENDALLKDIENNHESSSSSSTSSSSSSSEDEEDKEIEKIAKPASMEDLTPGTYIQFRDESTPVPDDDKALEEAIATEDIEVDELPKEDETLPMSGDPSMLEDEIHSLDADEMILDETIPVSEDISIPGLEITTADDDDELNSRESSLNEAAQLESEEIPLPEESAILLEEEINVPQEEAAQIEDDSSTEEKTSPSSAVDA